MALPGFSAAASLYKTSIDYCSTGALVQPDPNASPYMSIQQGGGIPWTARRRRCWPTACASGVCDPITHTCCPPERACAGTCLGTGYFCCKDPFGHLSAVCEQGQKCCVGSESATCYTPLAGETCCDGGVCDIFEKCCGGVCRNTSDMSKCGSDCCALGGCCCTWNCPGLGAGSRCILPGDNLHCCDNGPMDNQYPCPINTGFCSPHSGC
jgi:hypothetical protein